MIPTSPFQPTLLGFFGTHNKSHVLKGLLENIPIILPRVGFIHIYPIEIQDLYTYLYMTYM